ncbi:hypothetical protein C2E23DRAFT_757784 [Lenzites betulinus]|nr:hypothetical protein C2E23DRAFT_757784 [Lenzites betulinus]
MVSPNEKQPASISIQRSYPTRRAARTAARKARRATTVATTGIDAEEISHGKRPGTDARAALDIPKRATLRGCLQALPNIPLEVQFVIYGYLESRDLHHLSRTCKKFRAFFLDKQLAELLWDRARRNTGDLPARPPFMSEPAFIHLLYAPLCHYCGARRVHKIQYEYFIRLCASCHEANIVRHCEMILRDVVGRTAYDEGLHPLVFGSYNRKAVLPTVDLWSVASDLRIRNRHYLLLKSCFDAVSKRIRALPQPITVEAAKAFREVLAQEQELRLPYAEAVRSWVKDQEIKRDQERQGVRQRRFEVILVRLREVGWGPELDFLGQDGIDKIKKGVVRKPYQLTETSWLRVLAALDKPLNETREDRILAELCAVLRPRFAALEEALVAHYVTIPRNARMDCRPKYIDLALIPECRAIIDVPASETVTAEDFAAVIPAVVEKWEANIKKELTAYIQPLLGDIASGVDPLTLAIAVFECCSSTAALQWPDILAHQCRHGDQSDGYASCFHTAGTRLEVLEGNDAYTYAAKALNRTLDLPRYHRDYYREHKVPFRLSALVSSKRGRENVDRMRKIVSACGLDPASATIEELDQADMWLECQCIVCNERRPRKLKSLQPPAVLAQQWRGAFRYRSRSWDYRHSDCHEWRPVNKVDANSLRARCETIRKEPSWFGSELSLSCSLCPAFDGTEQAIRVHLKEIHHMEDLGQAICDGIIYYHLSDLARWNDLCVVLRYAET